jgi:hypothetical protein
MCPRNTILTAGMSKRLLGVLILAGWTLCASASYFTGGEKKKDAHRDVPSMYTFSNLKSKATLQLSLKTGLEYGLQFSGEYNGFDYNNLSSPVVVHSLMTYQKGNTIFVFPYKQSLLTRFKTPERALR